MIRIAVVDDEPKDISYISQKIKEQLDSREVECEMILYSNAEELLNDIKEKPYDIVFLDIDMPEITGMDAAEKINGISGKTLIVFVTNHDELVYKAYRFKAIGFIRKSHLDDEISYVIDVLINELNIINCKINITNKSTVICIDLTEVLYVQSDDHYVEFHFKDKTESVRKTMNEIDEMIAHQGFIRTHSRYLVNYRYIYSIKKDTVYLSYKDIHLPVSRSKLDSVKEKYQLFVRSMR